MNSTNDLDTVQRELDKLGVCDIKIFFTGAVSSTPNSDVTRDVAYLLSTYLRGDYVPLPLFGDSLSK